VVDEPVATEVEPSDDGAAEAPSETEVAVAEQSAGDDDAGEDAAS